MKNLIKSKELLNSKGVYQIVNTLNNKKYIGSTTQSFKKRCWQHRTELKNNKHKNPHLQHSYNKYGKEAFVFEIIKSISCDKTIRKEEQALLDYYNIDDLYNINTNAIVPTCPSILKRRNLSIKKATNARMDKYYRWKQDGCPEEGYTGSELAWFCKLMNPWNKGESLTELHINKLRTATRVMTRGGLASRALAMRLNSSCIEVYKNGICLAKFRSPQDLQDHSMMDTFPLIPYMELINKKGRNGYPPGRLCRTRVLKCAKENIQYKGLIFKSVNARCISNGADELDELTETLYLIKGQS